MSLLAPTFVAQSRHVVGAGAVTLEVIWPDAEGEPADITGNTVDVVIADADGSVLQASTAATIDSDSDSGRATVALAATHTARPRWITATWTRDDGAIQTTSHELVGGVFFTLAQARSERGAMGSATKYTASRIQTARTEAERECEEICGVAFVPRYARVRLDGNGRQRLTVPHRRIRQVLSVVDDEDDTWTAAQIAAVRPQDGFLDLDDDIWPCGTANLVVEYLHGWDRPPADMLGAHLRRAKYAIDEAVSTLPVGAFTLLTADGQITLQRPDAKRTGDHLVDAVYARYSDHQVGIA